MKNWIRICRVDDIPRLGARVVRRPGEDDVAVFRTAEDKVFAVVDRCPHRGGALSQGIVCGDKVACPLHNWNIALDTGCALAPDEGSTPVVAVKIEAEEVLLDLAVCEHA